MFMSAVYSVKSANSNYSMLESGKLRYVIMYLQAAKLTDN